jgi:hypothetical protein
MPLQVAPLVQLAALHDGAVSEHVVDRLADLLAAVDLELTADQIL